MSAFVELHDDLRRVARDLLGAAASRTAGGEPVVVDWSTVVAAGWPGLEVPEELGGAGATFAETAVILEELGRAAAATPYLGTMLGLAALEAVEPSPGRRALFAAIAGGEQRVAVAVPDEERGVDPSPSFVLSSRGLFGEQPFVPDAVDADRILVVAEDPDGFERLVLLATGCVGLTVAPTPVLDATRSLAMVRADGIQVSADAVWQFVTPTRNSGAVRRRGALAVAIDSLGVAGAMLDATVTYVQARHQFDRPIGSFQAVKHQLADALVQVTLARQLVVAAIADPTPAAVAMAKAHATAMAVDVAGTAMQLHGGIGYTWEGPVHVHLKRAMLNRSLFGSPRSHRAGLADRYRTRGAQHG